MKVWKATQLMVQAKLEDTQTRETVSIQWPRRHESLRKRARRESLKASMAMTPLLADVDGPGGHVHAVVREDAEDEA